MPALARACWSASGKGSAHQALTRRGTDVRLRYLREARVVEGVPVVV